MLELDMKGDSMYSVSASIKTVVLGVLCVEA
jgi:hypothetical protein